MQSSKRIIIIGAGPTGLGAASRLHEIRYENWAMYERQDYAGGHASSHVDEHGFTWDEGGHVIFSHYPYFDQLIERVLEKKVHERVRESWIVTREGWVPYPFQNNLRYLPRHVQLECLLGAANAARNSQASHAANFREWILATFGEGIAHHFMFPYNSKVWTTSLEQMAKSWIAERVAVVDFKRLLENVIYERDDVGWGPNSKFRFPLHGGTGEIYRRLAQEMGDKITYCKHLVEVDSVRRRVSFSDGSGDTYDALVNTAPLDLLVKVLRPADNQLLDAAAKLRHNNLVVLGIGLRKKIETSRCWMYFPDPETPFYRATYFSHYSPFNVPNGDTEHFSSLMCEVSYRDGDAPDHQRLSDETISALVRSGLLQEGDCDKVVSRYVRDVPYSYPIPTLDRDSALETIQPQLFGLGIYSRGRFGAWRYEVGNMDHSVQMGVEAVNHILLGDPERVLAEAS
jgi:protoporphyrinogen oxidase